MAKVKPLSIKAMPLKDLEAAPYNPRSISKEALSGLKASVERFGLVEPIVWNKRTKHVVGGHQRIKALQDLGHDEAQVVIVDLPVREEKALNLALNNPHIAGEFTDGVAEMVEEIGREAMELVEELRLDRLVDIDVAAAGYRAGEGFVREGVESWKDEESFFAMPEWLAPLWEKYSHLVVEYSGGKDSTAAAIWAAKHKLPHQRFLLIFCDPGVEFPGMSAHVANVAHHLGGEPTVVKSDKDWWIWLQELGAWPSVLYRNCAQEFVHVPFAKYVKAKLPKDETIIFTGSRAEEAGRGSKKTERSELQSLGAAAKHYQHFAPCFAVKKPVLEQVIEASGAPLWEGYSRGFVRTACWCCPGQKGAQALALQRNYPGLAEDIRRWEKKLGVMQPLSKPPVSFDKLVARGEKVERRLKGKADAK